MNTQSLETQVLPSNQLQNVSLWSIQVLLAGMFFMAGGQKLAGAESMVQLYNAIGIGQWFRVATGLIEVGSAALLLTPALSGVAAGLLASTMVGAIITHLFVVGGNPALPVALLVGALLIAWGRRNRTSALIGKVRPHQA